MKLFAKDIAVSLVDDSALFIIKGQTKPLVLPAYVAAQAGTKRVVAVGDDAKAMLGGTPDSISVIRVVVEGVIGDREIAATMFRFGLHKIIGGSAICKPRVVVACRAHEPAKIAVKEMALMAGVRNVYLFEMGLAAAIGMNLDVTRPEIKAVLSISDDWFDFSIISLAGTLSSVNGAIGSRDFLEDIRNHIMLVRGFSPELDALAAQLHAAGISPSAAAADIPGWEAWAGRVELGRLSAKTISRDDMAIGLAPSLVKISERIKSAIRGISNENQRKLSHSTIRATGSAMKIPGLAQALSAQLGYSVEPFASKSHPSIEGCKLVLDELDFLKKAAPGNKA
jgi:Actin-like ATPase involved in cell morphogenesis